MDRSLMYGYQQQVSNPTRRKKSKKRRQPLTRSHPEFYEDNDYVNWGPPPPPPSSASSGHMHIPPFPYPGVPDDLDHYMEAMNLYSPTNNNTNSDDDGVYDYSPHFLSHQYYHPGHYPPYDEDPMMFDNFYQGDHPPMGLSRQSSSRHSEPYPLPHPEIPSSHSDDHLMMADYPEEDGRMMVEDRWYSPIRPDFVQRGRRKPKRPHLQRSHSINTTQHYHEQPPTENEMYRYSMEPQYFPQSMSAPNSPRLFNEGEEDRMPGLQRSTSMQGPPMMMNGPPQRRHSYFEPTDQPSPDFLRPVVNSAPGTPWMEHSRPPPGVLPASMPSSSSLKAPAPTSSHSDQPPSQQQQYDQAQPKDQQQQQQQQHTPPELGPIGGNYFPQQPMMNRPMHQGGGMNMPMGLPPYMGHQGPRPLPMWNNNDRMGPWDPMMMGPMGPRPPPFGFPGGDPMMMMNPMMGGPMMGGPMMGGMMPPFEDPSGNKKPSKEDKKPSKDKEVKGSDDKKEDNKKIKEPVTIADAAAASQATTTPADTAIVERQLPPLNGDNGAMVRRKPSIWNLFGIGNTNRSMMMPNPYGMPTRLALPDMMMMADIHRGEHPKVAEMVEKFQNLMYVWCYVTPMENYQTAWCAFKIQNQRKLNHADRHGQRAVTLDKEKNLPGTVIVNPLSKTAVMYKSLWSTTKMIITIMRLPQEEYRRQQHALSPELMRRWGSKRRNPGYATGVFNSMFRDYPRN